MMELVLLLVTTVVLGINFGDNISRIHEGVFYPLIGFLGLLLWIIHILMD